jgi:branched-chain amino acid transport system substrate-binding protein
VIFGGCPAPQKLEVAVVVPETGVWSDYGIEVRHGVEIALEQLQADTAAAPPTIQWLDSESDPAKARRLLEEAFQGGAFAAIGGVTSAEAAQMVPVAEQEEKVLISPSASDPDLTKSGSRFFYRVTPSDFDEATRMAKFAVQDLKLTKVVILAAESQFGASTQLFFQRAVEAEGVEVVGTIQYPSEGADWQALATQAIALSPQGIYIADFATGVSALIRELRAAGFEGALLTSSAFSSPEAIAATQSEGVYLTRLGFNAGSDDPRVQAFSDEYRQRFGRTPSLFAALGFDSMMLMAESLKQGGGDSPNRLWQKLRGLSDFQGVTGPIQFDESGDVQKFPQIFLIQDGELVSFSDWQEQAKLRREELLRRMEELQRKQRSLSNGGAG